MPRQLLPLHQWKAFSQLKFAIEADRWLVAMRGKPVLEQLHDRNIHKIYRRHMFVLGWLRMQKNRSGFEIALNQVTSLDFQIETIGHEIGHTFHILCCPSDRIAIWSGMDSKLFWNIERFCDVFGKRWAAQNDHEEVAKLITAEN